MLRPQPQPRSAVLALIMISGLLMSGLTTGITQTIATTIAPNPSREPDLSQPLTIAWRYDSNLTLNLTPAFDTERVYLPLAGGTIVSLKAADGQLNWRSEMGGELSASPAADERAVYVASETGKPERGARRATGALRSLGREGGVTQWMRTLETPLRGSLTLGEGILLAGGDDGRVYAFDTRTGDIEWTYDHGAPFKGQPVVSESMVFIGSEDGTLLILDEKS